MQAQLYFINLHTRHKLNLGLRAFPNLKLIYGITPHKQIMGQNEYALLLERIRDKLQSGEQQNQSRLELPIVDVMWEGQKTFLRNFAEFPKVLRRDPEKVLQYLSKEFAVPAERTGDKAMFIGKREPQDFTRLFMLYLKDYVECPTCTSPDTRVTKENRISFLTCEACGAKSTIKGKYA